MLNWLCFTVLVLLHHLHQSSCNTCCENDEVFLIEERRCGIGEKAEGFGDSSEIRICSLTHPDAGDCYGNLLGLRLEDTEMLTAICTNPALDGDWPGYATTFPGDIRPYLSQSHKSYCSNDEILVVQNGCQRQAVLLVKNQTVIVTSTLRKQKNCGPELRHCHQARNFIVKHPKCCGVGFVYDSNFHCIESDQYLTPQIKGKTNEGEIQIVPPNIPEEAKLNIIIDSENEYYINAQNGYLAHATEMGTEHIIMEPFCTDSIQYENGTLMQVVVHKMEMPAMFPKSADLAFLAFETIFMGLTFLIHLLLPKFRNLPGTIIVLYTGTYLVWDFLRIHLTVSSGTTAWSCFIHLVALPYLNWSKCWWLFLFTIELLLRIKQKTKSSPADERKRLIAYCFIAWILNGLILFGICVVQGIIFSDFRLVRGNEGCNFLNRGLEPIMTSSIMLTPCTISGITDMILLIFVTKIIQETSKKLDATQEHQKKQLQQRFKLLVRLYALGITKLMYSATEICAMYLPNFELTRHVTLCIVQLIYAFVIFAIFCCKKSVFRDLMAYGRNKYDSFTSSKTYTTSNRISQKDSVAMTKSTSGEESVALNMEQKA